MCIQLEVVNANSKQKMGSTIKAKNMHSVKGTGVHAHTHTHIHVWYKRPIFTVVKYTHHKREYFNHFDAQRTDIKCTHAGRPSPP